MPATNGKLAFWPKYNARVEYVVPLTTPVEEVTPSKCVEFCVGGVPVENSTRGTGRLIPRYGGNDVPEYRKPVFVPFCAAVPATRELRSSRASVMTANTPLLLVKPATRMATICPGRREVAEPLLVLKMARSDGETFRPLVSTANGVLGFNVTLTTVPIGKGLVSTLPEVVRAASLAIKVNWFVLVGANATTPSMKSLLEVLTVEIGSKAISLMVPSAFRIASMLATWLACTQAMVLVPLPMPERLQLGEKKVLLSATAVMVP